MYKIFADDTLVYDSTLEDYKIGKGVITLEPEKSGSFVFSVYPDHFYYNDFVQLRTVITVYKGGQIKFRGRILDEVVDYQNCKVFTCEGELSFLQDSIIRPYSRSMTNEDFLAQLIAEHNEQVDEFKHFKVGRCTVNRSGVQLLRENKEYENTMQNLTTQLRDMNGVGGYFYITHGDDGADPIPTLNLLADYEKTATQAIEFGVNLKNYSKKLNSMDIVTAIIPLGATDEETNKRLTVTGKNKNKDYVYSEAAVALRGWVVRPVVWDDITDANQLLKKAEEYVETVINQNITVELTAIDLHLLDRSIESFGVCEYIPVRSTPHNFEAVLLCNKQTIDLLKPENDTFTLGHTYSTFTENSNRVTNTVTKVSQSAGSALVNSEVIVSIISRLDALEGVTVVVTVTDALGQLTNLLAGVGGLTIDAEPITESGVSVVIKGGSAMVTYALQADLDKARRMVVNGVTAGTVLLAGDAVTATVAVKSGDGLNIEFLGG